MRRVRELREWLKDMPDDWAVSVTEFEIRAYPSEGHEYSNPACFDSWQPESDIEAKDRYKGLIS